MEHLNSCYYTTRLIRKLELLDTESKLDFTLIKMAICWAKKYHDGQFRESGEFFYTHPLEVAYIISDYNIKTEVIAASILHDIVEDTEVTLEMISDVFGYRIAEIVDRLTRNRLDGNKLSVEEILNNAYQLNDEEVLLIKLIDRLHNIQTVESKSIEKIYKIFEQTFNLFISLSIILETPMIERQIVAICQNLLQSYFYNLLEKNINFFGNPPKYENQNHLLFRVYQNNSDLYQNICKQELI